MAKLFSVEEQLDALSPEQLEALKQELIKQRDSEASSSEASPSESPGRILGRGVTSAAQGFGEGALLGLQGRPISELSIGKSAKSDQFETLLKREQLKNEIDPTRRKSLIELEELERKRKEQEGGGIGQEVTRDVQSVGTQETGTQETGKEIPSMFISVPKGKNKFGIIEYDTIKNPEFEALEKEKELSRKKEGELKSEVVKGRLVNTNNLNLISGVTRDLSQVYADSFGEGGAGGLFQATKAKIATKIGDLPDDTEIGGKFSASGAFPGKRMELILKMMPMLTQQATKPEGSVRIITGVMDALGQTIPELGTAPRMADRQLTESLRTFYRFARAAEQMGMSIDEAFAGKDINAVSDDEISSWAQRVASQSIEISGEEKKAVDSMLQQALEPIRNIRGNSDSQESQTIGRFIVEVE